MANDRKERRPTGRLFLLKRTRKQKQPGKGLSLLTAWVGYDARGISEGIGEVMSPAGAVDGETEASGLLPA